MKILVAEDDLIAARFVASALSRQGHEVVVAGDGSEALERARAAPPDLIISDLLMPQMDGFDLCRAVKADPQLHGCPFVVYSSTFIAPEDAELARTVGASRFITKSADPGQFIAQLQEVLEQTRSSGLPEPGEPAASPPVFARMHTNRLTSTLHSKVRELEQEHRALRRSEATLHEVVHTVPDILYRASLPDLHMNFVSPAVQRLLGFSAEEMLALPTLWAEQMLAEDWQRFLNTVAGATAQHEEVRLDCRVRHRVRGVRYLEHRGRVEWDEDGTPRALFGSFRDITASHHAAQRAAANERVFTTLLGNLPGMVYRRGNDARWIMEFVSEGALDLTGYHPQDLSGRTRNAEFGHLMDNADRATAWRQVQQAVAQGERYQISYRIRHRDGRVRWLWEQGIGVSNERGVVTALEGFVADISDQKRDQQAIERTNRVLQVLNACSQVLMRHDDEETMLQAICDELVASGDYPVARLVFRDGAQANAMLGGCAQGLLAEGPLASEPVRTVLDTGIGLQSVLDGERDSLPWMAEARACGLEAVLALPLRVRGDRVGVLTVYAAQASGFDGEVVNLFGQLAEDLVNGMDLRAMEQEQNRFEEERVRDGQRLQRALVGAVESVALTIEKRDPYTAGHQRRVARLAVAIAEYMGLDRDVIDGIHMGATIHDIGKIYIPAEILNRPGRLDEVEMRLIRTHSQVGHDIIRGVDFPWPVATMVLQHHERLDGSGYPQGLRDVAIIPEARVLAVADVVEAINSHRPYRAGLGIEVAMDEIRRHRGRFYDPEAVDACIEVFDKRGFRFED